MADRSALEAFLDGDSDADLCAAREELEELRERAIYDPLWAVKVLRRYVLVEDDKGEVQAKIRRSDPALAGIASWHKRAWGGGLEVSSQAARTEGMQLMALIQCNRTLPVRGA